MSTRVRISTFQKKGPSLEKTPGPSLERTRDLGLICLALEDVVGHLGNAHLGELGADVFRIKVDGTLLARARLLVAWLWARSCSCGQDGLCRRSDST